MLNKLLFASLYLVFPVLHAIIQLLDFLVFSLFKAIFLVASRDVLVISFMSHGHSSTFCNSQDKINLAKGLNSNMKSCMSKLKRRRLDFFLWQVQSCSTVIIKL